MQKYYLALLLIGICGSLSSCSSINQNANGITSSFQESPSALANTEGAGSLEPSLSSASSETPASESERVTTERARVWTEDLNALSQLYKERHPDPFCYCTEEEFDFQIRQLSENIDFLSDSDIFFEMAAIIAGMGDNHTFIEPPDEILNNSFPFRTLYVGGDLYLTAYLDGYEQFKPYIYHQIVAINEVDITYITKKLESVYNPFNSWISRTIGVSNFFLPAFLDWAGCDYRESYTFQILNDNLEIESIEAPVVTLDECLAGSWIYAANRASSLFKSGNRAEYCEENDGNYIYMSLCDLSHPSNESYQNLFQQAATLIKEHPTCGVLIIDLRQNPGGLGSGVEYIAHRCVQLLNVPSIRKTYVLTGGSTASAAIQLLAIFKRSLHAITVGEPTGQFISNFGYSPDKKAVVLPNSQISVCISDTWINGDTNQTNIQKYYDSTGRPYEWENTVLPDVYVPLDIKDLRQGKDSAIQWILMQ